MASNILGNIGLVSRGMREAAIDTETLAQQRQATRRGATEVGELERASREADMGRAAVRSANTAHQSLIAQAEAARQAGNPKWQELANEAMQTPQRTMDMMADAALAGVPDEQIEQIAERNMGVGSFFDKGSLRVERSNGRVIMHATENGKPLEPKDITAAYAARQKPVTLGSGQAMYNPVTGQQVASNIPTEAAATGLGDVYYKSGPQAGQTVTKGGPRRTISISRTEGERSAQKDLPMFNAISKKIAGYSGMGAFDEFGNETLSEEGNIRAALANQIAQSNRNLDPATIANIAVNGKPVINERTGQRAIKYKGKFYIYSENNQVQPVETTRETITGAPEEDNTGGATGSFARGGKVTHKGLC